MRKITVATVISSISVVLNAQEAAAAKSEDNLMLYILAATGAVLLLGIMLLGGVMLKLAKLLVEKEKGKMLTALFLLFSFAGFAQDATTKATQSSIAVNWDMVAATAVICIELLTVIAMLVFISRLASQLTDKKEEVKEPEFQLPKLFDSLNASVAVEHEADILLDHDYDGIKELDNNLPPWWKYGFYLTIVWSVAYLFYYHVYGAPLSEDEYKNDVARATAEVEEYMRNSANNVDENTVTLADASGISDGATIYKANCAACHGNAGEGGVGPNVTDAYWIHGGSIAEVFKSIKYGWPAKGMKAWETDLSPVQIKNVSSYIMSLQGTNPANAKAAEGELFAPEGAATDTSATVAK